MSQIEYSYEIINTYIENNSMEILFTSPGRQPINVICTQPLEGQPLEDVIKSWAPIQHWLNSEVTFMSVPLGITGTGVYQIPEPPTQEDNARIRRNNELMLSDWTQLPDAPLTPEKKIAWESYRQALRDVPSQSGFPSNIQWPVSP